MIQARELEHARSVQSTRGYLQSDWDTGQRLRAIDGEHDLFGDGTVVCLPTYGHTPGHPEKVIDGLGMKRILWLLNHYYCRRYRLAEHGQPAQETNCAVRHFG